MVIVERQQVGLARLEPAARGARLALRAMPIATGVVGDLHLRASVATQYMSPQRRAAALLDGGHHLELTEAQVATLRLPPGRPVGAEDVRDLQGGALHQRPLRRSHGLQRTDDLAQDLGGHLGIERGGLEMPVSEQDLDHADIDLLLEQMSCKTMSQGMHRHALVDARCDRSGMYRSVQLPRGQGIDRILAGKQPPALEHLALRMGVAPPRAQALEQQRRQHGVAILVALALLNA